MNTSTDATTQHNTHGEAAPQSWLQMWNVFKKKKKKEDTTLCYDSLITLWKCSLFDLSTLSGGRCYCSPPGSGFLVPTVCSDKCSERRGAVKFILSEQGVILKRREEKEPLREDDKRVCESERHPTYPPPSSRSSWHRSIPVRLLISHEPQADCVNSAKWHPFSWSYSSFTQTCRQSQERILCAKAHKDVLSHARTHIIAAPCVLHNSCLSWWRTDDPFVSSRLRTNQCCVVPS